MASKLCPGCFRALLTTPQSFSRLLAKPSRTFTTKTQRSVELPEPNATPATSIPPVTPKQAPSTVQQPPITKVAAEIRRVAGRATETYSIYGVTENLIKQCSAQADYSIPRTQDSNFIMPKTPSGEDLGIGSTFYHISLSLQPTFSTWSQITMLHMYMLLTRFRCFDAAESKMWQQHLVDHFFYDAENRMVVSHNMHARGTRNGYLKDLFVQWRGVCAAYDEGVVKGDAVLAAAVWRNVFKGDEEVDVKKLAVVVSYLRRTLRGLEGVSDEVMRSGDIVFGDPGVEAGLVGQKSPMMSLPFKDGKAVNEPART